MSAEQISTIAPVVREYVIGGTKYIVKATVKGGSLSL